MSRSMRSMNSSLSNTSASKIFSSLTHVVFLISITDTVSGRQLIFSEKTFPFKFNNSKRCFFDDIAAHLGSSFRAVGENDGDFFYFETVFPCREFHFNLKRVTDEMNLIEFN